MGLETNKKVEQLDLPQTGAGSSKNTIVKYAILLMAITIVSKVFGFAREVTQAYYFGADMSTDAYLVAMTIPTVLFLSVSGAINNVFIPVYDRFRNQGRDKALVWKFIQVGLILATAIFIIPVFINTNLAVRIFAPAFTDEATLIAAGMLRILIFVIFFRLIASIITAVLHVNRNFLVPGMVGIPYSLVIMGFSFFLSGSMGINALVWGTFVGVGVQLLVLLPWFVKTKLGGKIQDKASDGLKEIAFLLPPVLMGTMAGQAKSMIDRMFASGLAEGSISFLNYAVRIKELPVGILVVAVITVLYPTIVSHANNEQWQQYRSTLANALNTMTFMILPMVAGFAVLAVPITQLIYQRGNFDSEAAASTAFALSMYSPGLIGTMLYRLMVKALYALRDTRTPLKAMLISVPVNVLLNVIFIPFLAHGGLALATSLSTMVGALYMYRKLSEKTGPLVDKPMAIDMGKSFLATAVTAIFCSLAYGVVSPYIPESFIGQAIYTGGIIGLSAIIYFGLAITLKITAMKQAIAMALKARDKIFSGRGIA